MLAKGERVRLSDAQVAEFTAFAIAAAALAGLEALRYFRQGVAVEDKGGEAWYNPVTAADRDTEGVIRARIAARYPDHAIYGEEHGHEPGRSPLTWVIDPIDGTKAFISGMLHWGVLIALYDGAEPVIGVMHQPFTDEYFIGGPNGSEYRRGGQRMALRVRPCGSVGAAALATTGTDYFSPEALARFQQLKAAVRMTRFGGDCYSYALVAHGQLDVVLEWGLKPYDIQALIPIVRGAGGLITDWQGGDCSNGGAVLCAGDPRVHEAVIALLAAPHTARTDTGGQP